MSSSFDSKNFLKSLCSQPGVYQMYGEGESLLYVGKAKNLKKRLSSYFRKTGLSPKTQALVSRIVDIQITVSSSEMEALILEQSLIKEHRPPYNILLRDDKSYPYILATSGEDYPRLAFHRGRKRFKGRYFGPFPNSSSVRETLSFLQKVFRVRQCEDSFYRNRTRPCLQFQIQRCSGPCTEEISVEDYARDVEHTLQFLDGKGEHLIQELGQEMEQASETLAFERAALLRDQIADLRKIQAQQVAESGEGDADVLAASLKAGSVCVHALFVRQGRILGSRSYFPKEQLAETQAEVLGAFIPQFYLGSDLHDIPREVIVGCDIEDKSLLQQALADKSGRQVSLANNVRTHRSQWLQLAQSTADQNLESRLANRRNLFQRFEALQEALGLEELPQRLECFDISHSSGELPVASCVVFDHSGPAKSDYRKFNIEGITPGDDYGAMEQALTRRYTRLKKGEAKLPDILFIDGGKGQLGKARDVMNELGISGVNLIGVSKGPRRKAGEEILHILETGEELQLGVDSSALHLVQHIRDEAHRFAVSSHQMRRDKKRSRSILEDIPGVGPSRRRELLKHFGGLQEVMKASEADLAKVPGISKAMAAQIYGVLH
ncbi:MAG: excinuclease ABC subunit UvrC [Cellvibrionaceae bacterium]